jgi:SAM-dependent methyltransferase
VDAYLRMKFPLGAYQPPMKNEANNETVDILIAGCGTGQHPIQTAQQFLGAKVLAVDLSLASLGYAKRKTAELGLTNIDYQQADIMRLGDSDKTFDIIEAGGVLHHLGDPVAGWKVLLGLLRPGGLLNLGFYSEIARKTVVDARGFIAEHGFPATAAGIRQCRQELTAEANIARFAPLLGISDFYAASACRDLLFHVQEHRYTLLQLKDIIASLGMRFIGLYLEPGVEKAYLARFPDDKAKTKLDNWHQFETDNPATFIGMYQFLVQKP